MGRAAHAVWIQKAAALIKASREILPHNREMSASPRRLLSRAFGLSLLFACALPAAAAERLTFNRDIRPIFRKTASTVTGRIRNIARPICA
jgi:hypothetical protein